MRHSGFLALGCVFALSAALGYREIFSPDIGYHMEWGRDLWETGKFPRTESFTYTVAGTPIRFVHWLFGFVCWVLYRSGGTLLLTTANIALTLLSFALLALRSTRKEGRLSGFCAPLLLVFALGNFWEIRPHVGSWLLLNALLLALEELQRGNRAALWVLPPVLLVWVNAHSLFVLGLVVIAVYGLDELRRGRQADRRFLLCAGLSVLACLVNPYGMDALLYPITQFGMLQSSHVVKSETAGTAEFLSPFRLEDYTATGELVCLQPLFFIQLYALVAVVAVVAGWRKMRLTDWLLFLGFGYVFSRAIKNHGYFMIATLPMVVTGLESIATAFRKRWPSVAAPGIGSIGVVVACALLGVLWKNGYLYALDAGQPRIGHRFSERALPVRACQFLNDRVPEGRILNNWDSGGYLRFATRRPVFVDGRTEILGQKFYAEYLRFKDAHQLPGRLDHWQVQIALVPFEHLPMWAAYFLEHSEQWRCVYADDRDMIFLGRGFAPEIGGLSPPRAGQDYPVFSSNEMDQNLAAGLARQSPTWFGAFTRHHAKPHRELSLSAQYLLRKHPEAAAAHALSGLQRSTFASPELLLNLGHALYWLKDYSRAGRCYQAFLKTGSDPLAAKRLQKLQARGAP